ncbi:adenosylcobinamide-GDP ribazoletransferase [Halovenus rubra]|uniref:Adenosylcobinamide-GDP ribazoletransferase n=2 Tax=Halovenus rubra TaxID=869890 RepID=A0ABD5X7L2_9EURY|nr:adenosylcobinamide-GDP ribazoletransferase [Halovenus rubra]
MVISALRGAVGFLTRVPVGRDKQAWEAFRASPTSLPLAGYLIGFVAAVALVVPAPNTTNAALFVVWLYLLTGITHLDGLADLGDALVVHGSADERRAVLKDTTLGVGGTAAIVISVVTLILAVLPLATDPWTAVALIITAEVTAKFGMATLVCTGTAIHEGLASAMTESATPRTLVGPVVVAFPVVVLTWPHPTAAVAFAAGLTAVVVLRWWARQHLGGINGDILGAGNEIVRLVSLHAGVMAWTQL